MVRLKLQSAMEYMMTYGWALLVIAVVLVALVALNIFSPSTGSNCVGISPFLCSNPVLSHTTGGLSVQLEQVNQNWLSANVAFVSQSQLTNPAAAFTPSTVWTPTGGTMTSGVPVSANVPVVVGGTTVGASYAGQLWVQFTTSSTSGYQYLEVASVSLKAS